MTTKRILIVPTEQQSKRKNMPAKTLTKKDKSRALKLGLATLKMEKQYAARQAKEKKVAADLKEAVKKIKVKDGPNNLYKVTLSGNECLVDRDCCGVGGITCELDIHKTKAVQEAIRIYSHKRIGLKPTKSHGYVNGVTFKDSDGRPCVFYQSHLSFYDTCYFGLCPGATIHVSESNYECLSDAIHRVSRGESKSVTLKDRDGNRFNIKPNDGGFVLIVLTKTDYKAKGEAKKKLIRNNMMRFDAKAAETISDIIDNFTSFYRNFE